MNTLETHIKYFASCIEFINEDFGPAAVATALSRATAAYCFVLANSNLTASQMAAIVEDLELGFIELFARHAAMSELDKTTTN